MSLPPDWQERMVAMIRGATPQSGEWFAGSATLGPEQQLAIYAEQYRLRIWDALVEDVPGLVHLLGDRAEDVLWRFLFDHPPAHWSLGELAGPLSDWLRDRDHPAAEVEMAALDRAVMTGFVAADGVPLRADGFGANATLALSPHVRLLRLTTSVHRVRSAVLVGEPAPPLLTGVWHLVVYRTDRAMRHLEVEPGAFAALRALDGGGSLEDAVTAAYAADENTPQRLGGWFALFAERGLVGAAAAR